MPFHYEFRFFPDGRVEQFCGSRGNYYEFQDGSRLDMYTTPVELLSKAVDGIRGSSGL